MNAPTPTQAVLPDSLPKSGPAAPARYSAVAIGLHWLIALGIAGTFALGFYMHDLPLTPLKLKLFSWHKWAGVTIFLFAALRLVWRATHRPPAMPAGMPRWQQAAASAAHALLYVLMFAVPLTGWLMSSAKGFQTVYFGVLPIPDLLAKNKELGDFLREVHELLNFTLAALVFAHSAAALKHHLLDRDDVLTRMLPFLRPSRDASAGAEK